MIWFCFAACGYCPPYSIYFRIWILQDHVTACVQFSMIFLFSVLFSSLFVIVFVWQGTHYWWWLSPLSRLVLRVETLVVFIRMFVFVFVDCLCLLLEMVFDLLLLIRIHICLIRVHNPIHWFTFNHHCGLSAHASLRQTVGMIVWLIKICSRLYNLRAAVPITCLHFT